MRDGQVNRALVILQIQYTESPHYSCILYAYGKYIIKEKITDLLSAGISAL